MTSSFLARLAILLFLLGSFAHSVLGEDNPGAYGGVISPLPGQNPSVVMERQSFWFDPASNYIRADYILRNTGHAQGLAFFIPEYWAERNKPKIEGLRVWVDGQRIQLTLKRLRPLPPGSGNSYLPSGTAPNALWKGRLQFQRRQERRVRVSFVSWGYGHESKLWLLYFPQGGWRGAVSTTDLNIYRKDARPFYRNLPIIWPIVRLFSHGWDEDYKTIPAQRRGHHLVYEWKNWKPVGFLMVVENN